MKTQKSIYEAETPVIVPGIYGNAEIEYLPELRRYTLTCNGVSWMETDQDFMHTRETMYAQYDLAYGDVLVTGLGFGILATAIASKEEVTSVTVLELSEDVIRAFVENNQVSDKLKIIQADATKYISDTQYDCLLPDHYELQNYKWRVKDMNRLAEAIPHKDFWPWSIEEIFLKNSYPRYEVECSSEELFEKYGEEIPAKWREFIQTTFNGHQTLMSIDDVKLIGYLKRAAKYYYDIPNPYMFF